MSKRFVLPRRCASLGPIALVALVAASMASLGGCASEDGTPENAPTSGVPVAQAATPTQGPASTPTAAAPTATATRLPPETTAAVALSLGPGVHDFTLPDAHGGEVTLSQYLSKKTVVLAFYRAWW